MMNCSESCQQAVAADDPDSTYNVQCSSGLAQQGYDYEFIPSLEKKYECPICLLCLREPMQTTCGHRFCKDCILHWLRNEGNRCPEDNREIQESDVFLDNYARREIMALKIKCPNTKLGCSEVMEISESAIHVKQCEFNPCPCPNLCGEDILQEDLQHHVDNLCKKRNVSCAFCSERILFEDQQAHSDCCSMANIPCQYCDNIMPRGVICKHLAMDCSKAFISCCFSKYGCMQEIQRVSFPSHMAECTQHHLYLLCEAVSSLYRMQSPASTSDENVDKALEAKAGVAQGGAEKARDFSVPQEKLLVLEQKNVLLEQKNRELELKVSHLEAITNDMQLSMRYMTEEFAQLQSTHCNGTFIWRIHNFSELCENTSCTQTKILHSPGFYTSPYGYKLCIRLNINGYETMYKDFVSVFVHLMRGDNDGVLDWPMQAKIMLSIMDQHEDSDKRENITETFLTKPDLAAFQRPVNERNIKGFGYMEFARTSAIQSSNFIKHDTLYIKATVVLAKTI